MKQTRDNHDAIHSLYKTKTCMLIRLANVCVCVWTSSFLDLIPARRVQAAEDMT